MTSLLEGLGLALAGSIYLIIVLLMVCVPIFAVYGTMFALSKLASRIRRGRSRR